MKHVRLLNNASQVEINIPVIIIAISVLEYVRDTLITISTPERFLQLFYFNIKILRKCFPGTVVYSDVYSRFKSLITLYRVIHR